MRESRTLEYKENLSSNTFLKTISAYANYGEGKIIFGINDQGNIIGITDPVQQHFSRIWSSWEFWMKNGAIL